MDGTEGAEGEFKDLTGQETPPVKPETTSTEPTKETPPAPKTYTEEDRKTWEKSVSDAKANEGRLRKAHEQALSDKKALEERIADIERKAEEAELEKYKDDPETLDVVKERQQLRKEKLAVEAEKRRHADDLAEVQSYKRQKTASEIAAKYGVNADTLIDLSDGTPEKMEALAKVLPKLVPETPKTPEKKEEKKEVPHADSGLGNGGSGELTSEQAEKLSMEDYAAHPSVKKRYGMK